MLAFQRRRAKKKHEEKNENTELRVEMELFLDDAVAEGLDPKNPRDLAIIVRAAQLKFGELEEDPDLDEMVADHARLNF
jgi:hypothetical protein